jgi:mannosyl-3-phosphoglycerate synthase
MLISHYTGFETEIVKTGNAGEHALTLDLAMSMSYATGYAIEPYHYIHLLEEYGGVLPGTTHGDMRRLVKICQIESRNPHFHAVKGDEHVEHMVVGSLATAYHSPLCPEALKQEIASTLAQLGCLPADGVIPPVRIYPNLGQLDLAGFAGAAQELIERRSGAPRPVVV